MLENKIELECLTFDDVLLKPQASSVLPNNVNVHTTITPKIKLKIPLISAAMDTVTKSRLAIAMAQLGGIGIIHKNMSIEKQVNEVNKVKRSQHGVITDPFFLSPKLKLKDAIDLMKKFHISGVPIVENGLLVGIVTNRDIRFETNFDKTINDAMTKKLITAPIGTTLEEAKEILKKYKIEKLPIVDDNYTLKGLITIKDIEKSREFPNSAIDNSGRLIVGAAVGTAEGLDRVDELMKTKLDLMTIDTAHGHSKGVLDLVKKVKQKYPELEIIAGNVATAEATKDLIKAGADAVKVGIGPGSICTTRIIAGVGVPQLSAVYNCAKEAKKYNTTIIADGGIKYSGDIVKALSAGANSIMIGSLLAGTDESPGDKFYYQGMAYKSYRGMGSISAMKQGSSDRYFQENARKFVPEGVEGRVHFKGSLKDVVFQLVGGLRSGMGYIGAENIKDLQKKAKFVRITNSGLQESHIHNLELTREAPNYNI